MKKKQLFLGRQHAIKCQKVFFSSFFAIWHFVKSMKLIRYLITTYLSAYLITYVIIIINHIISCLKMEATLTLQSFSQRTHTHPTSNKMVWGFCLKLEPTLKYCKILAHAICSSELEPSSVMLNNFRVRINDNPSIKWV